MSYKTKLTDIYPSLNPNNTPQNNGGVFGGIGYLGEKVGLGALQGIEGIWDYSAGGIAKLFGADQWAERQFANDWVNYQHADDWFDPSKGWQVAGDVASGIGTSLPSMAGAVAGGAIIAGSGGTATPVGLKLMAMSLAPLVGGLASAGTSTKEAYQQTGKLGGKEFGYGALSGLAESGMEFVTQGIGTGTGRITKAILAKTGKDTAKTMSRISGKSVIKSIIGDFASEAFEEGTQEMLDGQFKRWTFDPTAENATPEEVAYSAIIGGLSGAIMGGAYQGFNSASNLMSGNKAMQSGSADWYMQVGKQISDVEATDATGFEAFKETKETYEQLEKSLEKTGGEITTAKQKMLLGQLKGNVTSSVFMPYIERSAMDILANADRVAERFAKFKMTDVNGNPISFTAKDITSGINMELYKSENPADRREFFKQVREALSTNSTLATVAVMDTTGNIMLDTQAFAEATLQGENLADKADLNSFIENATPEEISAVQQALGIKDLADVGIEEFRASVGKYTATGKMGEAVKQYHRMQIIEGIKDTEQKPSPTKYNRKTKNGVYHIDGVNKVAVKKEGDKYYLYDKSRKLLSNALTVDEVNEAIKQIKNENRRATETESEPQQTNREEAQELDTLAKEQIKDYSKLNVHNQAIVRGVLRNARRNGISEPDALSFARISAHSGLDIKFSKDACFEGVTKDGEKVYNEGYYSARINKIVVNPEPETTLERTLLHELDHAIRMYYDKDGKIHSKTFKVAMDTVSKEQRENLEKLYAKQDAGVSQEELLADETNALATEQLLSNKGVLEKLVGEEPTFKEKVLEFFKKAIGWYSNDSTLEKASRKYYKTYKKLFDEFSARNQQSNFIEAPSYLGVDDTTKRKSFGGVKAKDYDKTAYEKAIEMDKAGKGSEAIRQDTGWFKGYDGKWRFEIDDSEMKIIPKDIFFGETKIGDILSHDKLFSYYPQLKDIPVISEEDTRDVLGRFDDTKNEIMLSSDILSKGNSIIEKEKIRETKEYKEFKAKYDAYLKEDYTKYQEYKDEENKSLLKYLVEGGEENEKHLDEVRANYKEESRAIHEKIDKLKSEFFSTDIGKKYKNSPAVKVYKPENRGDVRSTLIHEIQHAIQAIEGFANGSSAGFFEGKFVTPKNIDSLYKEAEQRYTDTKEVLRGFNDGTLDDYLKYENTMIREEELDYKAQSAELFKLLDEREAISKRVAKKGHIGEFERTFSAFIDLEHYTNVFNRGLPPTIAYYNTAGEIEARNTSARLKLDSQGRKKARPDIDQKDYVLAEEYELDVGNPYISAGDSSVRFNRKLVETHEDSIRKVVEKSGSMKPEALEQLFKKYREAVSIWDEVTKAVNSQFLNEWNGREGKDRIYSIFKAQMGYKYQQELASECKKGMSLFDTIDAMVQRNVLSDKAFKDAGIDKLGKREKEILYEILKGKGFQIPCAVCFVEQSRQREGEVIDRFLNGHKANNKIGWNSTLDRIEEDMKEYGVDFKFKSISRDVATDAYQRADLRMNAKEQEAFYKAIVKEANLAIDQKNAEIQKEIDKGKKTKEDLKKKIKGNSLADINEVLKGSLPANLKIFRTLIREPSSRLRFDEDLLYSSVTTSNLASRHPEFYTLFNSQGGQAGYKLKQSPVIYWGDLLEKKWGADTLRKNGGIRTQSNSDFQVYTFLDIAQEFIDMTAKGYYLQAYTKVVPMLKLFGLSGAKLNASLIPFVKVYYQRDANGKIVTHKKTGEPIVDVEKTMENAGLDENGNLLFDDFEGINHAEVFHLLEDAEYSKNVGAICIAYSDNHLLKLLDDDRVQLIIGFHDTKNNPEKRYSGARYVKNFNYENEAVNSEGKTVHIAFNEYVMDAERLFRKGKRAFSNKLSAKVKSMLENIDTQFDAEGKIESINFDGKQYKYDDIPRLSADIYLYDCKVKGYKPAYTNPSLDFNDPKQPFRHRNYYKVLADFSLYNSEGHYAPHRKINFNLPTEIPIYDKNSNTERKISLKEYLVGELNGELETRDRLAFNLAETGEDSIFEQFKSRATNPDYIIGSSHKPPLTLSYMGDGTSNAYKYYFGEGTRKSLKSLKDIPNLTEQEQGIFNTIQTTMDNTDKYWDIKYLKEFFEKNPQVDFITKMYEGNKTALPKLRALLNKIDDVYVLNKYSWYVGSYFIDKDYHYDNHFKKVQPYRGTVTKFRNAIKKRINEIMTAKNNGTNLGKVNGATTLDETIDLYYKLNADPQMKEFADKVFETIRKLDQREKIKIAYVNQLLSKSSRVIGDATGNFVEYKTSYFNDTAITDQSKANTILHELLHVATVYMINAQRKGRLFSEGSMFPRTEGLAVDQLYSIYNQIASDSDFSGMYGTTSMKEMVAELSNPEFVEKLQKKNLWERIIDAICLFLGIERTKKTDAYNYARICVDYILDNPDYNEYRSYANTAYNVVDIELRRRGTSIRERFEPTDDGIRYSRKNTAFMSDKRIDYLIEDSGAGRRKDYARAWITSINPTDFINMSTGESQNRAIFDKTEGEHGSTMADYDFIQGLKNSMRQTPFLDIELPSGKVVGHEGRHRMRALEMKGIDKAEIQIRFYNEDGYPIKEMNGYGNPLNPIDSLKIINQFGTGQTTTIGNIIPLNESNRELILENYGEKVNEEDSGIRYSRKTPVDTEYMEAVKSNNTKRAEELVQESAKKANFDSPRLYHGTSKFGFTYFNTPFIFATDDESTARGYGKTEYADKRNVSAKYIQDDGTDETLIKNAKTLLKQDVRRVSKEDISLIASDLLETAKEVAEEIDKADTKEARAELEKIGGIDANDLSNVAWFADSIRSYLSEYEDIPQSEIKGAIDSFNKSIDAVKQFYKDHHEAFRENKNAFRFFKPFVGYDASDLAIDIEYKLLSAMKDDTFITKYGNLSSGEALRESIEKVKNIGSYQLYANFGEKPLVIDANNALWTNITVDQWGEVMDTEAISQRAKEEGYTSVIIKNVYDMAMNNYSANKKSNVYVFFNPNQVKSADTVVYDDDGNIIPLSQRFNTENDDIRYSRKTPISPTRESVKTTIDPQYKPTTKDKIFSGWTAGQIAFTNQQAGIEAVGKQFGINNIESLVQSARAGKAQADEMIGGNQYRIGGDKKERLGDGLQKIFEPIVSQGEEVEGDFYDYLYNYHNISRMTLQERSMKEQDIRLDQLEKDYAELKGYQKQILKLSKQIEKLGNSKADKSIKRNLRDSEKEYREKSKELAKEIRKLEKESNAFVPLENKPVFSRWDDKLDMEVLVTAEDSKKIVKDYETQYPEFKETAEKVWKFLQNLNQYRVDTGLISQEMSEYLYKLYPNYVPTYRTGDTKGIGAIDGKYNLRVKSTIKTAKGSTRDLQKLDYIIAKQVLETVRAGRVNQLANALYEGAMNNKGNDYVEVVSKQKVNRDEMADFDPTEIRPKNNEVVFFRDGERITIRVAKEIFAGFDAFNPTVEINNPLINGAVAINNNFKRLVTSLNPAFLARNSIRDIQDAGINTRYGKTFLKNYQRAIKEITSDSEMWQLYKAMGGFSSTLFDFDKGIVGSQNKWGLTKAEGNLLKKTLTKVENANAFVEQLPRFAEFMSSLEAGNTAEQAVLDSADVTTNFGRTGKITKVLNRTLIPFLNPSIQGFSKMIRNITSIRTAKEFSTLLVKVALVGLAPQLLNALMYGDDDDYEELRMNDKENNFLLKIGNKFIKVPRGRVASAVGGLINRTATAIKGQDADWKGYVDNVVQQVSPVDSMSRTIFSPLIKDLPTNTTWYGSPIEGRQFENTAPRDRYDESTSSIAVAMGKVFNYSPKKIHYLLDQYSGVIGDFILPATTKKAERGFIGGNFVIDPELSNRLSTDFYKIYDKAQYAKTAGDEVAKYQVQYLNRVRGAISQMFKEKSKIQSSDLSKVEKLQQTRVVQSLINEAYKTALADYDSYTEAIKSTAGIPEEYRALEATRRTFGAKTAFEQYNKDVSAKMEALNGAGIDYDTLYSYYFGTKDIDSDTDQDGTTIRDSKRAKTLDYIKSLNVSKKQQALLFASKGYSFRDGDFEGMGATQIRKMLLSYILGLNIPKSQKEYLAKMCGFDAENGKIANPFVLKSL